MKDDDHDKTDKATGEYDKTLRYLTTLLPEQLVSAYVEGGEPFEVEGLYETQFAFVERRLDRNVVFKVAGERRVLHVEFQHAPGRDLGFRVFEYHAMLAMALHNSKTHRGTPITSIVVLLTGPRTRPPVSGEFQTSPQHPEAPWCGVRFVIDPLYDLTVADLLDRKEPFWLLFAPLTRDASESTLEAVVERLEQLSELGWRREDVAELATAMVLMGEVDQRNRGLDTVLEQLLNTELIMTSTFLDRLAEKKAIEIAEKIAEKKAIEIAEKSAAEGRAEGLQRGLLQLVTTRFGDDVAWAERLTPIHDEDVLGALFSELLKAEDKEEALSILRVRSSP